jgi:alkanesulfonate monooxygenase SsuD/methylene tetrahydromethanopterin reductase-like flavin-dependent oxidoreductase (luciferase family)
MIEGQEDVSWPQWVALAEGCERHGIGSLFRSDHYLSVAGRDERGSLDAWGTTCALAAVTTKLRLGTLVSPATFRHPSNLAKLAVTADRISDGRITVGLGAGWHTAEHTGFGFPFAETRTRMDVFAEQLEIVRGLWGDEPFEFSGAHYRLERVDARPKPVQRPLPLIVGGKAGPRSAALAARFADEYNTTFPTPEQARERRAAVARAWSDAGRDPDTLRFSVMTGCVIGADAAQAAERARRLGLDAVREASISGSLEQAADQLRALAGAGVDRVMLQLLLHDDLEQLELIAQLQREL